MPDDRTPRPARRWAAVLLVLATACVPPGPWPERPARGTPGSCPVTTLGGPPPDAHTAAYTPTWYGTDALWAGPSRGYEGRWYALPDGMKVLWWRGIRGPLAVTGRRLDALAPALTADIPAGYGPGPGIQSTGLRFPTPGCWEVTGRTGAAALRFVVEVRPGPEWAPGASGSS